MTTILNLLYFTLQIFIIGLSVYFFLDFKKHRKAKLQKQKETHTE